MIDNAATASNMMSTTPAGMGAAREGPLEELLSTALEEFARTVDAAVLIHSKSFRAMSSFHAGSYTSYVTQQHEQLHTIKHRKYPSVL